VLDPYYLRKKLDQKSICWQHVTYGDMSKDYRQSVAKTDPPIFHYWSGTTLRGHLSNS